jgi:hypothetical protein
MRWYLKKLRSWPLRLTSWLFSHQTAEKALFCLFAIPVVIAIAGSRQTMWIWFSQHLWIVVLLFLVWLIFRLSTFVEIIPTFRDTLWRRHTGEDFQNLTVDQERAVVNSRPRIDNKIGETLISIMGRITDRQINKARGILPFNSVLLAILAYEKDHLNQTNSLVLIALLSLSSLCCLFMFPVKWTRSDPSTSISKEFDGLVRIARQRSMLIECAIEASAAALIMVALAIAAIVIA